MSQAKKNYAANKQAWPDTGTAQYVALRKQAMQFLVQRCEFEQKASDLGIKVTDSDVDKQLATIKSQYFGKAGKCDATCEQKFQAELKKQNLDLDQVRDDVRASVIQNKIYEKVTAGVQVSDKDVADYYKKNKAQYVQPESRDVRHILVKKKALADQIYQQLQNGASFAALAKKYSTDPSSKDSGGKLTISKGRQVPEFDKVAFALKTRELGQPVKTTYGWHVIQALTPIKPKSDDEAVRGEDGDQAAAPRAEEARGDAEVGRRHVEGLRVEDELPGRLRAACDHHRRLRHHADALAACRSRTRSSSCKS